MSKKPHNINEKLSVDFGEYLDGGSKPDATQDELISVLAQFREEKFVSILNSGKEEIWLRISEKISNPSKIHHLEKVSVLKAWSIAATILIASFVGLYMLFTKQSPSLVLQTYAQSGRITLLDGTEVLLRPNSKLVELSYSDLKQEYSLEGEAYFQVTKNTNRAFIVTSGNGMITVLGTRFNLSNWGGGTQVYLEEGSVKFENTGTSSSVVLEPGESAKTTNLGTLVLDEDANADEFNDWRNNQLIFNNREVEEIINELEQHFDIIVRVSDAVNKVKLSGGISLQSSEQSLEYLALILNGTFEQISEREYHFIPSIE